MQNRHPKDKKHIDCIMKNIITAERNQSRMKKAIMKILSAVLCTAAVMAAAVPASAASSANVRSASDYVTQLYRGFLGREPDSPGLNSWTKALKSGKETGCSVAAKFATSKEFVSLTGGDYKKYISSAYKAIYANDLYNLTAFETEWAGKLNWHYCTREKVLEAVLASDRMAEVCKSAGIKQGTFKSSYAIDGNEGAAKYVLNLYRTVLGRSQDSLETEELEAWVSAIAGKRKTASQVASGFFGSREYAAKKASNETFVKTAYLALLGREADAPGLKTWIGELKSGKSRDTVIEGLANSAEFASICGMYGIAK